MIMKDYSSDTKKTVTILKDIISLKGYDYIYDNAQHVHRTLIEKGIDKSIADVTLYVLAAGTAREDKSNIAADVEEKLFLNEDGSAVVSDMFSSLYDRKAMSEMKKERIQGA